MSCFNKIRDTGCRDITKISWDNLEAPLRGEIRMTSG